MVLDYHAVQAELVRLARDVVPWDAEPDSVDVTVMCESGTWHVIVDDWGSGERGVISFEGSGNTLADAIHNLC